MPSLSLSSPNGLATRLGRLLILRYDATLSSASFGTGNGPSAIEFERMRSLKAGGTVGVANIPYLAEKPILAVLSIPRKARLKAQWAGAMEIHESGSVRQVTQLSTSGKANLTHCFE